MVGNVIRAAAQRLSGAVAAEDGMSTAEYSALVDYIHVHPSQADTRSYRRPTVAGH